MEKRCPHCNNLFFKLFGKLVDGTAIEAYCKKCKKFIVFK